MEWWSTEKLAKKSNLTMSNTHLKMIDAVNKFVKYRIWGKFDEDALAFISVS